MKSGKRTRDAKIQTLPEIIEQTRIEHVGTQCTLIGGPSADNNTQTSDPSGDVTTDPLSNDTWTSDGAQQELMEEILAKTLEEKALKNVPQSSLS